MKKYIGNVIVTSPNYKIDECYNKCLSFNTIDESLPTIIIGLENAKKYIENFNILKKNYKNDSLWWTFSKNERRIDYDVDINNFFELCINNIINKLMYNNINIIELTKKNIIKYIKFIKNSNIKLYFVDNNKFVFIYDINDSKKIYGLSLNTCAFFGISKNRVLKLISNNPNNKQIKNFYSIPNNIRRMVNDDIPSEILLSQYF